MKEFDFTQIKHYKLYNFIKAVFRPLVKLVFKAKFKGLENVPQDKGTKYIVAINHTSAIDPIIVACPKELPPLHFMAKVELFKNPFGAWFLTHMYAFPVKRGKGDTSAIEYGEKILNEGHVMAICPEGKRIKDKGGVPQKAKAGVAIVAKAPMFFPLQFAATVKLKPVSRLLFLTVNLSKTVSLGLTEKMLHRVILKRQLIW